MELRVKRPAQVRRRSMQSPDELGLEVILGFGFDVWADRSCQPVGFQCSAYPAH